MLRKSIVLIMVLCFLNMAITTSAYAKRSYRDLPKMDVDNSSSDSLAVGTIIGIVALVIIIYAVKSYSSDEVNKTEPSEPAKELDQKYPELLSFPLGWNFLPALSP